MKTAAKVGLVTFVVPLNVYIFHLEVSVFRVQLLVMLCAKSRVLVDGVFRMYLSVWCRWRLFLGYEVPILDSVARVHANRFIGTIGETPASGCTRAASFSVMKCVCSKFCWVLLHESRLS